VVKPYRLRPGGRYEATMLRALREAQYDDNVIGFYQSTTMGAFLRQSLISTQASHHETLRQGGIALIHGG
jgi:translation initiation factor 3 subunit H